MWAPLLKIDHEVKLQNFGNNSIRVVFSLNLAEVKTVQHDKMDLCQNFQKDPLTNDSVMGLEMDFFARFYISTFEITGWIETKLSMNVI